MHELTPEQFGEIARKLPELRSQVKELKELSNTKLDRINEIFAGDFAWSSVYEYSFEEQIARLAMLLNIHTHLIEATRSESPHLAMIDLTADGGTLDQWYAEHEEDVNKKYLLWFATALYKNVLSIMLHHQSLGELVQQVREGSDDAFFKAVMVDRSILSSPTFASRLAKAEFLGDKDFFIHLRRALKGPSKKYMATISDIRYGIVLLREAGFDSFTDDQLVNYFVKNRLYPDSFNAAKNLRKHIQVAKKFTRT